MDTGKKAVLVPWDFTKGSEIALKHALQLAGVADNEIMLLHIIPQTWWNSLLKKRIKPEKFEELKRKLEAVAEKVSSEHKISPISMVLEGNPVKIIRDLIVTANLNLIVTHKCYSYEKKRINSIDFLKKLAIKNYNIPFIIAEAPPAHNHYIEIVVPLDYDKKYKETLHWIIYLSKYYKCNINLIKPYISDQRKKKEMANNIYFTKKMLDGNKIVYGIKTAKRQNIFRDEIFKFANNIDADLILIMADKYDAYVKKNRSKSPSRIPIMCITPRVRKLQGFA
ncbi:MAG: universal stress protein [Bacteroidales bacterium]|nr:universal stress protein [Bacteroidales bacterium]MDD3891208.1 universal stress protein [Bacteroidales bacterium]